MAINVDYRHADFEMYAPLWREMRHAALGEWKVKAERETYLKRPSGQIVLKPDDAQVATIKNRAYDNYLMRAHYPDLVYQSIRGLLGIIQRKPHRIELPSRLDYLRDTATIDGAPLTVLISRLFEDVLTVGRVPLATDFNDTSRRPFLCPYDAEMLINWRTKSVDGAWKLALAVIEQRVEDETAIDPFEPSMVTEWMALFLENGRVVRRKFRADDDGEIFQVEGSEDAPSMRLSELDELPLTIIGTSDLLPDVERPPLLGLSATALAIYRNSADYEQALHMTAQPTPTVTGIDAEDPHRPRTIGAGTVWYLPDTSSRASMLEFSGAGCGSQRQAMIDKTNQAIQQGVGLIESQTGQAESGEAKKLRQSARTSTLHEIVGTVEGGLLAELKRAALWADANPDQVVVELNRDFHDVALSAQDLTALVQSWQQRAISHKTLYYNLKQGEIIPPDSTFDEEIEAIAADDMGSAELFGRVSALELAQQNEP